MQDNWWGVCSPSPSFRMKNGDGNRDREHTGGDALKACDIT